MKPTISTHLHPTLPSDPALLPASGATSAILQAQGCTASDWTRVLIHRDTDLSLIRGVRFYGDAVIGLLHESKSDSERPQGIYSAVIRNCYIGDGCYISNVLGELSGCVIGRDVAIQNVGRIRFTDDTLCGIGTPVEVLDESGSRPVYLHPGLDAQMALLMTWKPRWAEDHMLPLLEEEWEKSINIAEYACIADGAVVAGVGDMLNVGVGHDIVVEGASRLVNGLIINNAASSRPFAFVGAGVDAENFIVEDGRVDSGVLLRNVYVGQGAVLEKYFCAHDSLFFANCACENGEACALLAGPYTVSMHKSSLLIGALMSFMNAGSATNSSNHLYKLGPVHWGIMERGVKTASGSYLMWGARIGAFSMVMGSHKAHPDTSFFPFSYLFEGTEGETVIVPGAMLRSCGLMRDETKWPNRDNRLKRKLPLHDRIVYPVLNPRTITALLVGLRTLESLRATEPSPDGFYHLTESTSIKAGSVEKGISLYSDALLKYFARHISSPSSGFFGFVGSSSSKSDDNEDLPLQLKNLRIDADTQWLDMGGQVIPRTLVESMLEMESSAQIRNLFDLAFENYLELESRWVAAIARRYCEEKGIRLDELPDIAAQGAARLDALCEMDRQSSRDLLSLHNSIFFQ